MAHINTIILDTLDPFQCAYRANRSTDDKGADGGLQGYRQGIDGAVVEQVESFKFLFVRITKDLSKVQPHQHNREEGTTIYLHPREAEKIKAAPLKAS
jgi:hypothetical protein